MDWMKLIGGGFAHMSAPFALHPSDKKRARAYRDAVRAEGLDWLDVVGHVDTYADKEGWTATKRTEEMQWVKKYMGM